MKSARYMIWVLYFFKSRGDPADPTFNSSTSKSSHPRRNDWQCRKTIRCAPSLPTNQSSQPRVRFTAPRYERFWQCAAGSQLHYHALVFELLIAASAAILNTRAVMPFYSMCLRRWEKWCRCARTHKHTHTRTRTHTHTRTRKHANTHTHTRTHTRTRTHTHTHTHGYKRESHEMLIARYYKTDELLKTKWSKRT